MVSEENLIEESVGNSSSDVYAYGLGNWYLFEKKDTIKAKASYQRLLENGNPYSFAYLCAESDYNRIFDKN